MVPCGRRQFGIAAASAGVVLAGIRPLQATAVAVPGKLAFEIFRKGSSIGHHAVQFTRNGADITARIDVQMRVGLGPITFFRYSHSGEEIWQDGRFVSLSTQTNHNGTRLSLTAMRTGDRIKIQSTGAADQSVSGDMLPLTHWNVRCMHNPVFNPEDGNILKEISVSRGEESVKLSDGSQVQAMHYALAGQAPIDDWYDDKHVWTALRAQVKDGSVLHYVREV